MRTVPAPEPLQQHPRTVDGMPIEIVVRNGIGEPTRERFHDALASITSGSRRPRLFARGSLERDRNPSVDQPVRAEAVVDLGGCSVRAHATARTSTEAIDLVVHRLRRELREQQGRKLSRRRRKIGRRTP